MSGARMPVKSRQDSLVDQDSFKPRDRLNPKNINLILALLSLIWNDVQPGSLCNKAASILAAVFEVAPQAHLRLCKQPSILKTPGM